MLDGCYFRCDRGHISSWRNSRCVYRGLPQFLEGRKSTLLKRLEGDCAGTVGVSDSAGGLRFLGGGDGNDHFEKSAFRA